MPMNLITDRTAADVARFYELRAKGYSGMTSAERSEWANGVKGAYDHNDLNRVGTALNTLLLRVYAFGYLTHNAFSAKQNWTLGDIPTRTELSYYLNCVAIIRGAITQFPSTPTVPADDGTLDYIDANNIEKICVDIERVINNISAALNFCGDLYCGEVI